LVPVSTLAGDSSFVVMTNYIMTEGQSMGTCPELPGKHNCNTDADCEGGSFKRTGNGEMTGVCVNRTKTCEVLAWCPVEDDRDVPDPPLLLSAENYTLFIKNSVTFPAFRVSRSNLVEDVDSNYISSCLYHPLDAPLCPIFKLGDIIQLSGLNFQTVAKVGGAIGIVVDWTCNFDVHDKIQKRTLLKVFGIRFDIIVQSLARKFDIIPTFTAIGSGVGIFGVATVVCDLVLLYLLPKREFYKNMKFKYTDTQVQVSFTNESQQQQL
uniref:Uncharacterized protein n=1 Tax=Neolamprologus brichardi TaxID=32507 RepID=A0A3Q4H0Z6_NEOBR